MEKATQIAISSLQNHKGPEPTPISDTIRSADPAILRAHVQQLNTLTARIEEFLSYQIHRLESMDGITPGSGQKSPDELDRLIDEFEDLRRSWELERKQESERLQSDAEHLRHAWDKLEVEQRQLLTRQAAIRTVGSAGMLGSSVGQASVPAPVVAPAGNDGALYPTRSNGPRAVNSVGQHYDNEPNGVPSHKAQIQFQQLRREMQKHAQQRNKR